MTDLVARALDPSTWPDFARLVENNNGVWGGCWCMAFHPQRAGGPKSAGDNRRDKDVLVQQDRAHAALVYEGADCVGWCQFGPTAELPRIKHRKAYSAGLDALPDWRITCFFVGRGHRHRGVSSVALGGALQQIGQRGGGVVESYPEDAEGRKVSSSFLHNGTVSLFDRHGFERVRQIGKNRWVVRRLVP